MKMAKNINILIVLMMLIYIVPNVRAISDDKIIWSTGNTYRMSPTDNSITVKEYTIKVVDFPPPVRGIRTITGSTVPERPIILFAGFELYKDIVNNPNPVGTFILGINDQYTTSDKEVKITLTDMPSDMSQDWIYEYYDPWANIKIQKRTTPNLNISIDIDENIDENTIDPGDDIRIKVRIKNTGEDVINNIDYSINPDPLLKRVSVLNKLKDVIYKLNGGEEKITEMTLTTPLSVDGGEYYIQVNVTGYDIKNIRYDSNTSKKIRVRDVIKSISINKTAVKGGIYLKESMHVTLTIINNGPLDINNIRIYDTIPEKLIFTRNGIVYNFTEFSPNKTFLGSMESWDVDYNLKPIEPGIYVLPKFRADFSIWGRQFSMISNDVGFRVFGPKVVLSKSAIDLGDGSIEVRITAKNIGNGFTSAVIKDQLPENAILVSGKINFSTSIDANKEKIMSYTIKVPGKNIGSISWPPANAIYLLDDYKFTASSNEKVIEIPKEIVPEMAPVQTVVVTPQETPPEVGIGEGEAKKVVATIPAKTPIKTPQKKKTPGFELYGSLLGIMLVIIFIRKERKPFDKNR